MRLRSSSVLIAIAAGCLLAQDPDERPKLKRKTADPQQQDQKAGAPKAPATKDEGESSIPSERAKKNKEGDQIITDKDGRVITHKRSTGQEAEEAPPITPRQATIPPDEDQPMTRKRTPAPKPADDRYVDPDEARAERETGKGRSDSREVESSEAAPAPRRAETKEDLVMMTAEATYQAADRLPDFIVDQQTFRSQGERRNPNWKVYDRVQAEVAFVGGKEEYRNLRLNGKPVKKDLEESGTWSTGEFGTVLLDIFSSNTQAQFKFYKNDRIGNVDTQIFDFTVLQPNSHWNVKIGGYGIKPAYKGSLWINPVNNRVYRMEMHAVNLPGDYPADSVESAVDYGPVRIGANEYHMPLKAAVLSCQRGSTVCSKNEIEFRNYRKFTAESTISTTDSTVSFDEEQADKPAQKKTPAKKK
jgi:hypothetical protein